MKLRYFYKVNKEGHPILGSNIERPIKPNGRDWYEIIGDCCDSSKVSCNCGMKYFVQVNKDGSVVSNSLIKRSQFPGTSLRRYKEVSWSSCCANAVESGVPNVLPIVTVMADAEITLPVNSIILTSSTSDSDGTIDYYHWTQVSGPNFATIATSTDSNTQVLNLIEGSYTFMLTVTDNLGATANDTVTVIVSPAVVGGGDITFNFSSMRGDCNSPLTEEVTFHNTDTLVETTFNLTRLVDTDPFTATITLPIGNYIIQQSI